MRLARVLAKQVALRGHAVFSGVYQSSQMPALLRIVFQLAGGRFGDLRDWAALDAWTDEIKAQLAEPHSTTSPGNPHEQPPDYGPPASEPDLPYCLSAVHLATRFPTRPRPHSRPDAVLRPDSGRGGL
jgi:hypothetical protein